jgi:DNA polymerase I-like protein with 3'-5' exonuclease and polymerase domains
LLSRVCDELISEVLEKDLSEAKRLVKHEMKGVGERLGLSVSLKEDLGVVKN